MVEITRQQIMMSIAAALFAAMVMLLAELLQGLERFAGAPAEGATK